MRRRELLTLAGGSLTVGLAGCLGDDEDADGTADESDDATDDSDDTQQETDDTADDGDDDTEPESEPASFEVSDLQPVDTAATVGAAPEFTAQVTNTGDETGTKPVEFRIDGEAVATVDLTLDGGESEQVAFEPETDGLGAGQFTHSVWTEDSEATGTLELEELLPAAFEVSDLDPVEATVDLDGELTVSATVTNTGEESGSTPVELRIDGESIAETELSLDGGQSEPVEFEVGLLDLGVGEFTHSIWTPDDEASGSFSILEDAPDMGTLSLSIIEIDGSPARGATVSGDGISTAADQSGVAEFDLEVGTYDLNVFTVLGQATTTVEIEAETTTEQTVELEQDTDDLVGFEGTNDTGFISFGEDTETEAREEGLDFPPEEVSLSADINGDRWESTDVSFEPLEVQGGLLEAEVTAPNGIEGVFEPSEARLTFEGELQVSIDEDTDFAFDIAATTETSGALDGSTDFGLGERNNTITVVDNEFTVEDETGDALIDSALGLPIEEPGQCWMELELDLTFIAQRD